MHSKHFRIKKFSPEVLDILSAKYFIAHKIIMVVSEIINITLFYLFIYFLTSDRCFPKFLKHKK